MKKFGFLVLVLADARPVFISQAPKAKNSKMNVFSAASGNPAKVIIQR